MPSPAAVISSAFRWVGAWAFAVVAASFVLMGGFMLAADVIPETLGSFTGFAFAAFFLVGKTSFFPAIVLTSLLRLSGVQRGWSDVGVFALAAPLLYHAVVLGFDFSPDSYALADAILAAAGAVGGGVYWYLAGCPRPPYAGWFGTA